MNDATLIDLWINDRFPSIIEIMEGSMRELGFDVRTQVERGDHIAMKVVNEGKERGVINLSRILQEIATRDETYDTLLSNPLYEAGKINRVLSSRINAAKAVFNVNSKEQIYNGLQQISREHGINFTIIERD